MSCHNRLNLLFGVNGSGKTSLLESIYLLSRGKSFRTSNTESVVSTESKEGVVFAELLSGDRIGLSRGRSDKRLLKLNEERQSNWDTVAQLLPVLVVDANTFQLLEGGPKNRRQYLDWGVFHVEHSFIHHWRVFRKALANRNQLLKVGSTKSSELAPWTEQLIQSGEAIHLARESYIASVLPLFSAIYQSLERDNTPELSITYFRGWSESQSFEQSLAASFDADIRYRSTQVGPQRADIHIKAAGKPAAEVLSRGQQKMVVSALKIAQGELYSQVSEKACIYLIDDLPAELDPLNRSSVLQSLRATDAQLFVTCVEQESLEFTGKERNEYASFHVERGKISAV